MQNLQYDENWSINGLNLLEYTRQEVIADDCYRIGWFRANHNTKIETFLDIGANLGITSIFARTLFPEARVVAIEPCTETYQILKENTQGLNIECHNRALGDQKSLYLFQNRYHSGGNQFLDHRVYNEPCQTIVPDTLYQMCIDLKITSQCIIKIDIECGEYYLLRNEMDSNLLSEAEHVAIEIHALNYMVRETWKKWMDRFFVTSHDITQVDSEDMGAMACTMTKKVQS